MAKSLVPPTVTGTEVSIEVLNKIFTDYLSQYISSHLPTVYYWKNDPKHLLPTTVTLSSFQANPNTEPALKTLFNLAGYDDIVSACNNAEKEDGDLFNLLANVGEKATIEFQKNGQILKVRPLY